ncbi:MAG: hypothetical protein O3A51_05640 [Verrucomicrobia bacterium]|nr:hypothetical protein [Verrucomicrobiota bacterium]
MPKKRGYLSGSLSSCQEIAKIRHPSIVVYDLLIYTIACGWKGFMGCDLTVHYSPFLLAKWRLASRRASGKPSRASGAVFLFVAGGNARRHLMKKMFLIIDPVAKFWHRHDIQSAAESKS